MFPQKKLSSLLAKNGEEASIEAGEGVGMGKSNKVFHAPLTFVFLYQKHN